MKLAVAIPDTSLSDESLKIDKTRKAAIIARTCAIFGVDTIFVYKDGSTQDGKLLMTLLRYLETPQFLRKQLFPKLNDLKFAGVLYPLRIPSHNVTAKPKEIKSGDIREGMVVTVKGKRFVDIGINQLVQFYGKTKVGRRVTIQFKEGYPKFIVKEIERQQLTKYWGYITKERSTLSTLLQEWTGEIILTTRKAKSATRQQLDKYVKSEKPTLLVFGSPERGIHDILGSKIKHVQNAKSLNFFPDQMTQTVRLEEALLGVLAILNHTRSDHTHSDHTH